VTLEKKLKQAIKSNDIIKIHNIFEEIYTMYGKLIYFKISQYIDNSLDVEELTQDVFVSFYNNILHIEVLDIKYYLVTAAKNKAIDFLKKKEISTIVDDKSLYEIEDFTSNNSQFNEIIDAMKCFLNDFEIEIILKHNLDGYSFKELSKMYKKPLNTILSIYHRSLKKFKKGNEDNER